VAGSLRRSILRMVMQNFRNYTIQPKKVFLMLALMNRIPDIILRAHPEKYFYQPV
jgi:hypothetical protein